jgi:hypothetical protein
MQMAASVVANEFVGHGTGEKSKARPFKGERVGHPERRNQFLGVDVLEWYHPTRGVRQLKNYQRVGHPPFHSFLLLSSVSRCVLCKDKVARSLRVAGGAGFEQRLVARFAVIVEVSEPPSASGGVLF